MKPSQIGGAALPMLVGTWNYVNETYSGIIKYGKVGDFHLTIPSSSDFCKSGATNNYGLHVGWGVHMYTGI